MSSSAPSITTQPSNIFPATSCQQCGATDKKIKQCSRCHIEKYCSRNCQQAAWPKHKEVCQLKKEAVVASSNITHSWKVIDGWPVANLESRLILLWGVLPANQQNNVQLKGSQLALQGLTVTPRVDF